MRRKRGGRVGRALYESIGPPALIPWGEEERLAEERMVAKIKSCENQTC